jgi:hypothetical protein
MRSVKQAGHGAVMVAFYALCALGCSASALYTKLTPNMYVVDSPFICLFDLTFHHQVSR